MSIEVTVIEPCGCGTSPRTGDVGGNNQEVEICCPKCGRSVLAATFEAAIKLWDRVRLIVGGEISGEQLEKNVLRWCYG